MAFNLLDAMEGFFSRNRISEIAGSLGESESSITKAISGLVPAVLTNLISKGESGIDGASKMLAAARGAAALPDLQGAGGAIAREVEAGKQMLGDRAGAVTSAITSFAGIKESSAAALLGTVGTAAMHFLGRQVNEQGLTAGSLSNWLSGQKSAVAAALPAGLGHLLPVTGAAAAVKAASTQAARTVSSAGHAALSEVQEKRRASWTWALLLAVLLIILVFVLARGCGSGAASNTTAADTTATAANPVATPEMPGLESIKVKLPDGTELDAYKGGIEDRLVAFLNSTDPADSVSNSRWFDFDNLNFRTGSAEITDSSMRQVQNIAAILHAYPKVRIKIGGYTDKTGNEPDNLKLSQQRADAVVEALKKAGAVEGQLAGATGYGSQFAKAEASAPDEQRKPDRRISVSVRSK